jgi:hypothetical protein
MASSKKSAKKKQAKAPDNDAVLSDLTPKKSVKGGAGVGHGASTLCPQSTNCGHGLQSSTNCGHGGAQS